MINLNKVIILILIGSFASTHLSLSQNIEKYYDAVGGRERWSKIRSLKVELIVAYYGIHPSVGESVRTSYVTKMINSFGQYRIENSSQSESRTLIYDGSRMKEFVDGEFVYEASNEIIDQYKKREINFGEPWIVLKSDSLRFVGEEKHDGRTYEVFEVAYLGLARLYFIDKSTHLLAKITMFNGVTVGTFDDYKDVDGYLVPFTQKGYVNDKVEHTTKIKTIQINKSLPDSLFLVVK